MNRPRMALLLDTARRIVAEKMPFDMEVWKREARGIERSRCGTVGCLFGTHKYLHPRIAVEIRGKSDICYPYYDSSEGFEALAIYFNIGLKDAKYIFLPSTYSNPGRIRARTVLARLEKFMQEESA